MIHRKSITFIYNVNAILIKINILQVAVQAAAAIPPQTASINQAAMINFAGSFNYVLFFKLTAMNLFIYTRGGFR